MADAAPDPDSESAGDTGGPPGTPLWVKVTGAVALVVILLIAGVLVFGGEDHGPGQHGSGDGDPDGDHGGDGNHSEARAPATWLVEVEDNAFTPSSLTIQAGDTVQWVHVGSNFHTVTSDDDGETFDSHPDCDPLLPVVNCMANEDEFEYTFEEAGEIVYHCKVHASMTGEITVLEEYGPEPDHHG